MAGWTNFNKNGIPMKGKCDPIEGRDGVALCVVKIGNNQARAIIRVDPKSNKVIRESQEHDIENSDDPKMGQKLESALKEYITNYATKTDTL